MIVRIKHTFGASSRYPWLPFHWIRYLVFMADPVVTSAFQCDYPPVAPEATTEKKKKKNLFPSPWPKVALALVSLSVLALVLVFVLEKELLLVLAFIRDSSSHRHTCTSLFPPEREKKSISTLEIASRSVIPCHLPATCLAQCLLFGRRKKPDKVGIRLYLSCSQFIVPCTQTTLMKGCGAVINIKLWEIFFLG